MKHPLIPIEIKALVPASGACMIFLGDEKRTFVIHIDPLMGQTLDAYMRGRARPRPFTHDLINAMLRAFGGNLQRVVISDVQDSTFFARLFLEAENEIREKLLVELDARPSDSIALSVLNRAPLFATPELMAKVQDVTPILESMKEKNPASDESMKGMFDFDETEDSSVDDESGDAADSDEESPGPGDDDKA